ncbi:DUF1643 domain-containing protein [Bifidobacterium sp. H1HS16N]|uniref:DUF1643 domain-containing protein n=1 Tax=Bifidobacterium kimbladii TaxID=1293826 RepID=A0ABU3KDA1_9BIFI|nr:DUF1643 domain-containing protein [Bifidobacterium sp. H1HS16N]MDT7508648.1 DUF1643 domain-containing protein [Bifidobacterium sp. H1HS16N]
MDFKDSTDLIALTTTDRVVFSKELNDKIEDDSQCLRSKNKYRYEFTRIWGQDDKLLCFIMFNPSTTDNIVIDRTTNECSSIAKLWGYHGIALYNLYAFRSRKPGSVEKKLKTREDRNIAEMVGPRNEEILDQVIKSNRYNKIVCAWGNHPHSADFINRSINTIERIGKDRLLVLGETAEGQPVHPLANKYNSSESRQITEKDAEVLTQQFMKEFKKKFKLV